jgi:hypothetical protein
MKASGPSGLREHLCGAIRQSHSFSRGFFAAHFFSIRPRNKFDRQSMCNLLFHMGQKVVITLAAASAALLLCVKNFREYRGWFPFN